MDNKGIFEHLNIAQIIILKRINKATPAQETELLEWTNLSAENLELFNNINDGNKIKSDIDKLDKYNASSAFSKFQDKVLKTDEKINHISHRKNNRYLFMGIAASVLVATIGIWNYNSLNNRNTQFERSDLYITAGGNNATLILDNGQRISLSDEMNGELASERGVKINKTKDGEIAYTTFESGSNKIAYNTIQTPRGGQYKVSLPDGTKVWLNSLTTLKYPANFVGLNERRIELIGEAYFEVEKQYETKNGKITNKRIPFIVNANKQSVEVLGTKFSINNYADEPVIKTTLIDGLVNVSIRNTTLAIILSPGSQSIVKLSGESIEVKAIDVRDAIAWKDGQFMFNEENLETIMREISRWYNVDVEFRDEQKRKVTVGGSISKFSKISKVLRMLEHTGLAEFEIDGNKVIVK